MKINGQIFRKHETGSYIRVLAATASVLNYMGNTTDIINADELASILESKTTNVNLTIDAKNLLEAINDWPTPITNPEEFLSILHQEIGKPLTRENIERYVSSLDAGKSAWKMESFASVLTMFDNHAAMTFDEIVVNISNQFKNGKPA